MNICLDCLPCMFKQVLEASRMATDNTELQEMILTESMRILSNYKQYSCSPELALAMHQIVKKHTGKFDPYEKIKKRDIKAAIKLYPFLKSFLYKKNESLYWALKIAAVGNIIDSAIFIDIDIERCIEKELDISFGICDIDSFEDRVSNAKTLLIIGDNAGETVFDKVLAEYLAPLNIIYAVRSEPIINDACVEEAVFSGLDKCTTIVSTGCNAPGAVLSKCSREFVDIFNKADIVISKGQGNYEALSDCNREIYFLLKAKCPMISKKIGVNLYDYVFIKHDNNMSGGGRVGKTG